AQGVAEPVVAGDQLPVRVAEEREDDGRAAPRAVERACRARVVVLLAAEVVDTEDEPAPVERSPGVDRDETRRIELGMRARVLRPSPRPRSRRDVREGNSRAV